MVPKMAEDGGTALYLFDMHSLYRIDTDKTVVKVNRGVFLAEPTDISHFRIGEDVLWFWSASDRETIKLHNVKIDDL